MSYKHVAELNNMAVRRMVQGRYEDSIDILQRAIVRAQTLLSDSDVAVCDKRIANGLQHASSSVKSEVLGLTPSHKSPEPMEMSGHDNDHSGDEDHGDNHNTSHRVNSHRKKLPPCNRVNVENVSHSYVYQRAFHLTSNRLLPMDMIVTIIIFNLGLVHHLLALSRPSSDSDDYLKSALLYYSTILTLLVEKKMTDQAPVFVVVIVNNMAVIYHSIAKYKEMIVCFEDLKRVMRALGPEKYLSEQEWKGILWNVVALKAPSVASAA